LDADAASVAEPQLTIDDDAIASSKSFGNTAMLLMVRSTRTSRNSTVESGLTTKT
jgi:hypothetical protein